MKFFKIEGNISSISTRATAHATNHHYVVIYIIVYHHCAFVWLSCPNAKIPTLRMRKLQVKLWILYAFFWEHVLWLSSDSQRSLWLKFKNHWPKGQGITTPSGHRLRLIKRAQVDTAAISAGHSHQNTDSIDTLKREILSLGKGDTALENMCLIFKYLLILISNIIPQWWEQTLYDFNTFRP